MRLWQEALVPLVCLLALGCRTNPNIVLLERENRELENTVYELQDCLDQYQRKLDACQRENAALAAKSGGAESTGAPERTATTPQREAPAAPRRKSQPVPPGVPEQIQPPQVELPSEATPTTELPQAFRTPPSAPGAAKPNQPTAPGQPAAPSPAPGATTPSQPPGPPILELPSQPPSSSPATEAPKAGKSTYRERALNTQVAKISIDPQHTGGYNHDGQGGDDGITVLIQPRDAQGRPCVAAAPISVVLVDPALAKSGDAARVARWDFTAEEVAGLLKASNSDQAIRLAMLWPQDPPLHDHLQLFVRYTTDNGQKLQADSPIQVALAARQARNWAPALLPQMNGPTGDPPRSEQAHPMPVSQTPSSSVRSSASPPSMASAAAEPTRPVWSPNRR